MTRKLLLLLPILGALAATALTTTAQRVYLTDRKPMPGDEIAAKQPGTFINGETAGYKPGYWDNAFAPGMTRRTDKMLAMMKETFPGPTGFDVHYIREMFQRSYVPGIRSYMMTFGCETFGVAKEISKHQSYAKRTDDGGYIVGGLGGPTLYFKVNDPSALLASGITLDFEGRSAHMTFSIQGNWKGCVAYGARFFSDSAFSGNGVLYLCITRNGESPFIPFTRKQVLQAELLRYDTQYSKDTALANRFPVDAQKQVDDARKAGKPTNIIAPLQNNLRAQQQNAIASLKIDYDKWQANRKLILTYLATKPADTLSLPATIYSFRDGTDPQEWFNPKNSRGSAYQWVVDNPAYWHNTADKATPQLIVLKMQFSTEMWREYEVKKQFVANFPVEKFQELIDK